MVNDVLSFYITVAGYGAVTLSVIVAACMAYRLHQKGWKKVPPVTSLLVTACSSLLVLGAAALSWFWYPALPFFAIAPFYLMALLVAAGAYFSARSSERMAALSQSASCA